MMGASYSAWKIEKPESSSAAADLGASVDFRKHRMYLASKRPEIDNRCTLQSGIARNDPYDLLFPHKPISNWLPKSRLSSASPHPISLVQTPRNQHREGAAVRIERIVSGGQTGVDRAALDVAIALEIPHGGWCPLGRIAEDGPIPSWYQLEEHSSPKYTDRTKRNVIDSDATLVLYSSKLEGGTFKTYRYAECIAKPCLKIRLTHPGRIERVHEWLEKSNVRTLNIAGPRASKEPEIYQCAFDYLMRIFG